MEEELEKLQKEVALLKVKIENLEGTVALNDMIAKSRSRSADHDFVMFRKEYFKDKADIYHGLADKSEHICKILERIKALDDESCRHINLLWEFVEALADKSMPNLMDATSAAQRFLDGLSKVRNKKED